VALFRRTGGSIWAGIYKRLTEHQEAFNEAKDAIHKILFRERSVPSYYVKNGKTTKGNQRYLDKRTGKSVTLTHQSIVRYTKKTYHQWSTYIQLMLYGLSLRECAKIVNISTTTAFHWRHKIMEAMRHYQEEKRLKGDVQVDETYVLLNMKGSWRHQNRPRAAKKRGTPARRRGINQEHVCVLIAMDEDDHILTKVIGQGHPNTARLKDGLMSKIEPGSTLITDSRKAYEEVSYALGCKLQTIPSGQHRKGIYNLGLMNQYHSELKTWLSGFKGVSTKHLEHYLFWFRFMKIMRYTLESKTHSAYTFNYTTACYCEIRSSDIFERPFPIDVYKPYQHLS
jgi:transposase-like protein